MSQLRMSSHYIHTLLSTCTTTSVPIWVHDLLCSQYQNCLTSSGQNANYWKPASHKSAVQMEMYLHPVVPWDPSGSQSGCHRGGTSSET